MIPPKTNRENISPEDKLAKVYFSGSKLFVRIKAYIMIDAISTGVTEDLKI